MPPVATLRSRLRASSLGPGVAAAVAFTLLGFAITPWRVGVLGRELGVADFGAVSIVIVTITLASYVCGLGTSQFVFRSVAIRDRSQGPVGQFLWSATAVPLGVAVVGAILTVLLRHRVSAALGIAAYPDAILPIGVAVTCVVAVFGGVQYLYGQERLVAYHFDIFLRGNLWSLAVIAWSSMHVGPLDVVSVAWIMAAASVVSLAVTLTHLRWVDGRVRWQRATALAALRFGLPLLPYIAGIWGMPAVIRYVLANARDTYEVGLFSLAYALSDVVFVGVSNVFGTVAPRLFRESARSLSGRVLAALWGLGGVVAAGALGVLWLLREPSVRLLGGGAFTGAAVLVGPMVLVTFARYEAFVLQQTVLASGRSWVVGAAYAVGLISAAPLTGIGADWYGAAGAGLGAAAAFILVAVFMLLASRQRAGGMILTQAVLVAGLIACVSATMLGVADEWPPFVLAGLILVRVPSLRVLVRGGPRRAGD